MDLRVVDPDGNDVPRDGRTVGEIVVRGDNVMKGYWKLPEATAEALRDGCFHTGDLATMDAEGYVLIVDRAKDIIISGGENISSVEIENVLYKHPDVLECAVIAVPDEKWGEVPAALAVLKKTAAISPEDLATFCRGASGKIQGPQTDHVPPRTPENRLRQDPEGRTPQAIPGERPVKKAFRRIRF